VADLGEIFSRTSDAVFAIDGACRIVYRNEIFADLFQCPASEGSGRACYEVVCGRTLDGQVFCSPDCPVGKSLTNDHPVENFDLIISPAHGDSVWVSVGSFPLPKTFHRAVAVFLIRPINVMHALNRLAHGGPFKENGETAHRLTPRERQILKLLAEGHGTKELADVLHISHITARNHIHNIFEKLDVHSRAGAVSFAYRNSLL